MTTNATVTRVAGLSHLVALRSFDTASFAALFGSGALISAFFHMDQLRDSLGVNVHSGFWSIIATFALTSALVWYSLLRRAFIWMEPAGLTWLEFGSLDRVRILRTRLWTVWSVRALALAYVGVFFAVLTAAPTWAWVTIAVILVGGAVLTYGFVTGFASSLRRPAALNVGRQRLVHGWYDQLVRATGLTFLDPMLLLPSARGVGGRSLRAPTLARLAWLGVLGRKRYAGVATLLLFLLFVLRVALPGLPGSVLVALVMYIALVPFAGGLGELWLRPGLRRWVGGSDLALRAWHAVVFGGIAAAWVGVLGALSLLAGPALSAQEWLAAPLITSALIRTVTRPRASYDNLMVADLPFGQVPVRLVTQLSRGPDIALIGVLVLMAMPLGVLMAILLVGLFGWGLLR